MHLKYTLLSDGVFTAWIFMSSDNNLIFFTFNISSSHYTCTFWTRLLHTSSWIKYQNVVPDVTLSLKGPEVPKKKTAEWEYKWTMESKCTSQFFFSHFSLSYASHIYALLFRSTVCLPEFEMLMISSVLEIRTLFLLSVSPSPLLAFVCLSLFCHVFFSSLSCQSLVPSIPQFCQSFSVFHLSVKVKVVFITCSSVQPVGKKYFLCIS